MFILLLEGIKEIRGEIKGTITTNIIGTIKLNTSKGVYGIIDNSEYFNNNSKIRVGHKNEIIEGKAKIYCTLNNNKIKGYDIIIEKVLMNSSNKNMVIRIIDEELLNITGGIIQGMSGSPIVQNDKIIGAVTHVFFNDPTKGYGVFIDNMLTDINKISE